MGKAVELAERILENAKRFEEHFESQGLQVPEFDLAAAAKDVLPPIPGRARDQLIDDAAELQDLVRGPRLVVRNLVSHHAHLAVMQAVYRYGIATHVPAEGDISYGELSKRCGLNVPDLKRVVRYAMTCRLFAEPRRNHVAHSGASQAIADTEPLRDFVGLICEEFWPAAVRMVDAMHKWPDSQEANEAGYQLAHDTSDISFKEMAKSPARVKRFASAMSFLGGNPMTAPTLLIDAYPWASLGEKVTLIDLGGSRGAVCALLAKAHPNLECTVQDLPETIAKAEAPEELKDRLKFMVHDFFTDQPVTADVYFFRWIFHDWPDKYCINILRSLIPAIKPGARVLLNETLIPPPGAIPVGKERLMRSSDLLMWSVNNAKERDATDFEELFKAADPRFVFKGITTLPASPMCIVEAVWTPDATSKPVAGGTLYRVPILTAADASKG